MGDDERLPERDDVRARDDPRAVDVLLESGADVRIARGDEADDARTSGSTARPVASAKRSPPTSRMRREESALILESRGAPAPCGGEPAS